MYHIVIDARVISSSTGRYIERLITSLQDIDRVNRYTILVRKRDEKYWKPRNKNFNIRVADFDNYSFAEQLRLNRLLRKLKPDLVHFCMPQQPILYRGAKVTTFHDLTLLKTYNSDKNWLQYHIKQAIGKNVFKKVSETSDHIICVSKYTKHELQEYFKIPDDKISVIYESSDVGSVAPKRYQLPYKKFLFYVGQQSDYKNIKRLGDAHQILLAKYPNLGLVLAGKKDKPTLANEQYFRSKNYNNIMFTGFVSDGELSWLYKHATAYIFPSLMEGFGLPGLEAMEHGLPVVSSNATCLPEIYGQAAHYFNPTDTSDIAEAIDQVLSNDKLRTRLSKNGFKQIKKYSWKKTAQQTHKVYLDILKSLSER